MRRVYHHALLREMPLTFSFSSASSLAGNSSAVMRAPATFYVFSLAAFKTAAPLRDIACRYYIHGERLMRRRRQGTRRHVMDSRVY